MKLIIHAGTHKTATTTFQYFCGNNNSVLLEGGLLYPSIRNCSEQVGDLIYNQLSLRPDEDIFNHSILAWLLQGEKIDLVELFLKENFNKAKEKKCNYLLLSGEDFENVLVDFSIARKIISIAKNIGFNDIDWIFVKRNAYSYMESIYAELSGQGFSLNFLSLYETIRDQGFFTISNKFYNWIFIFDLYKRFALFKENISESSSLLLFKDFIKDFPGKNILSAYLNPKELSTLQIQSIDIKKRRVRPSPQEVEFNYICNHMNSFKIQETYDDHKLIFDTIINHRLRVISKYQEKIKLELTKRYDSPSS